MAAAFENPMSSLAPLRGVVVIDEAQRCPQIFPVLRVLVDRAENPARFLISGSASPELSRQASESLAGRVEIIEMGGFHLGELAKEESHALWLRGGFPRSFLAGAAGSALVCKCREASCEKSKDFFPGQRDFPHFAGDRIRTGFDIASEIRRFLGRFCLGTNSIESARRRSLFLCNPWGIGFGSLSAKTSLGF